MRRHRKGLPNKVAIPAAEAASACMADRHTPFLFDDWYVAAFARKIGRTLFGNPVVM